MRRIAYLGVTVWMLFALADGGNLHADPAQYGMPKFEEGEIEQYMQSLSYGLRACEAEWIAGQFVPGATIQIVHADGTREVFIPADYAKVFSYYCRPHQVVKWESIQGRYSYSTAGFTTVVQWSLGWDGGNTGGQPRVTFNDWVELVKDGHWIRIARAGSQVRELISGAEEEFYARTQGGDVLYPLYKVSVAFSETVSRIWEGMNRLVQGAVKPKHDADHAKAERHAFAP
ncbi:MAG: hypothetical protein HY599_03510 [Candidatus Omnitrophica bacterium]|nr:hypothetical protein [Candidatus Omnitrophota bacterium]